MIHRLAAFGFTIAVVFSFILASPVHAAAPCSPPSFLGMPAWYRGLQDPHDCSSINAEADIQTMILTIALNILQAAMVIVAYVAVGFIIKGGYMYMVSTGSPDAMAKAKNTIRDALIGLVIAISAAAIVDMIAGVL